MKVINKTSIDRHKQTAIGLLAGVLASWLLFGGVAFAHTGAKADAGATAEMGRVVVTEQVLDAAVRNLDDEKSPLGWKAPGTSELTTSSNDYQSATTGGTS